MKKVLICLMVLIGLYAQKSSIIDPLAQVLPRYTDLSEINTAITAPTAGMTVYNLETHTNWTYDGTAWVNAAGPWTNLAQNLTSGHSFHAHKTVSYLIPANNTAVDIPLVVDLSQTITNANQITPYFTLYHLNASNIKVSLISPAGTEVALSAQTGGANTFDRTKFISFNHDATQLIPTNTNPIPAGTYYPSGFLAGSFASLVGQNTLGTWKLRITDVYGANNPPSTGVIEIFGLIIGGLKKIGIGTANPSAVLEVNGPIRASVINTDDLVARDINTDRIKIDYTQSNRSISLFTVADNNHQVFSFGYNENPDGGTLRYQIPSVGASHSFYAGTSASASNELLKIKGNGNLIVAGKIENESQQNPTFQNVWQNQGSPFEGGKFYKDKENRVHLSGSVTRINTTDKSVIFTLPIGYRPSGTLIFIVPTDFGEFRKVSVEANGDVSLTEATSVGDGENFYISLSGISFKVN